MVYDLISAYKLRPPYASKLSAFISNTTPTSFNTCQKIALLLTNIVISQDIILLIVFFEANLCFKIVFLLQKDLIIHPQIHFGDIAIFAQEAPTLV